MVREDILGMLKIALQRGKNLQQTAQSLINSGYPKEEVDDAVQAINSYGFQQPIRQPIFQPKQVIPPRQPAPIGKTQQIVSYYPASQSRQPVPSGFYYQPQQFFPPEIVQRVSSYEQAPKGKTGNLVIIIMVIMLVILLGILVTVFLFKPELTEFINGL